MDRNQDTNQIVIAKEFYEKLRATTNLDEDELNSLDKHVRKFNPFLQEEHQRRVREFEKARSCNIFATRVFANHHKGKTVYVVYEIVVGSSIDVCYTEAVVFGISPDRQHVILEHETMGRITRSINDILLTLPDNYALNVSPFDKQYRPNYKIYSKIGNHEIVIRNDNKFVCNAVRFGKIFNVYEQLKVSYHEPDKPFDKEDEYQVDIVITKLIVLENNISKVVDVNIPFIKDPYNPVRYYVDVTYTSPSHQFVARLNGVIYTKTGITEVITTNINLIGYVIDKVEHKETKFTDRVV